ncbi:MAG: leucine-rich repeat domain-containing protein [Candidatus Methanoplasma sp.]|nr:leucine-rich repeat domain-containing protein [Candidatus Methanoplasma sp.]
MSIAVLFAVALFLATAFFITYPEPNESDAVDINSGTCGGGLTWTFTDDGVLTVSGTGKMNDYYVNPGTRAPWYEHEANINCVIIGPDVTHIGGHAFNGYKSLTSVTIGNSVMSIGNSAFQGCTGLTSVVMPKNMETIGESAFRNCFGLEYVTMPNTMSTIGVGVFQDCIKLKAITMPDNVTFMSSYVFAGCKALESIKIPAGVESIGLYLFCGCVSLQHVTIPETVKSIHGYSFMSCASLETIDIPDSVTSISSYDAFRDCTGLISIVIPDSVTSIGDSAFRNCKNLKSVTMPDSASICGRAFLDCAKLKSVTITGGLDNNGKIAAGGIIDTYFKKGVANNLNWTLPDALVVESLTLRDISSVYDPNDTGSDRGIAGAAGRELRYRDARFIWDDTLRWETGKYIVTLAKETGISGFKYSINNGSSTEYTKPFIVGQDDKLTITALLSKGYEFKAWSGGSGSGNPLTVSPVFENTSLTASASKIKYTVTLAKETGISGFKYTVGDGSSVSYAGPFAVSHGDALSITALFEEGYELKAWSGGLGSGNPLDISSVSGKISLTASASKIKYTVTLAKETGISGLKYTVNNGSNTEYTGPFTVTHGDALTITASLSRGYAFGKWSAEGQESPVYDSKDNPLNISEVKDHILLTVSGHLIQYTVVFDSDSDYPVYVNGSSASSSVTVTEGENLIFKVKTPEGYVAYPSVVSGNAKIVLQTDGWYRISDVRSDISIRVTVNAVPGDGSGTNNGSSDNSKDTGGNGDDSGIGSGNGGNPGNGSGSSISYWIPIAIAAAILACAAAALTGQISVKRRKEQ